jgi:hypothetical protein
MCTPSVRGRRLHQCRHPLPVGRIPGRRSVRERERSASLYVYAFRFNTPLRFDLFSLFSLSLCHTLRRAPLMTITTETRKPYSGNKRSLALAFDVGTTFSGVSYAILEPDEIPKIHGVTRCVQPLPSSFPLISLSSASLARNMSLEATKYPPSCTTMRKAT